MYWLPEKTETDQAIRSHSAAFTDKTKVVIINTPHNPSGKVFSREELTAIAEIFTKHDVLVLADEVVCHKLRIQKQGCAS
jgi:aspartate/methionine/tyrosine aminotransferase